MKQDIQGFPYFDVEFRKTGEIDHQPQVTALMDFLAQGNTSDLLVISHGWNNDMSEANQLYTQLLACFRQVLDTGSLPSLSNKRFAVLGILWPSKKFAVKELIPSGAAGLESPVTNDLLRQELEEMKSIFNESLSQAALDKAKLLVPKLEDSPKARKEFADLLRSLVTVEASTDIDAANDFLQLPGNELIHRLSKPLPFTALPSKANADSTLNVGVVALANTGSAAGLRGFLSGIKSGALNLLNYTTYYQMKERAGVVGSTGVNQVLHTIHSKHPDLKIHMIGHSFGGRLVTAATASLKENSQVKIDTLALLQAAFSHYGFSERYNGSNDGFFRAVITRRLVQGPIIISCTSNDQAVGKLYPLASLIAGQAASNLGDKNDKYGGIGRNGAQKTPEAIEGSLLELTSSYAFKPAKLYNLNADKIIKDHSDICHKEVAYAILSAVMIS